MKVQSYKVFDCIYAVYTADLLLLKIKLIYFYSQQELLTTNFTP